jgi:site-specific DNA-cytosine methylase
VVYRDEDEPAFTLTASDDNGNVQWLNARRDQREDGSTQRIPVDQPAPTMSAVRSQWEWGRPATTVACDDRLWPPGHKADKDDPPGRFQQRRGELARRLTVEEGLILQGFPPGVSIEGNKTEQWRLLGNAVPPRWAAQLVAALA